MRRTILALVTLALVAAAPSFAGWRRDDPSAMLRDARAELREVQSLVDYVRDPALRVRMEDRLDRVDFLVGDAARTLDGLGAGPPGVDFRDALARVEREPFDSGKMRAIEALARNGRFTTDQVRQLVGGLAFDSSKVDALILLYPSVVDPQRYFTALDVLTFDSSRRKVEDSLGI
jgi:hypothetical protein